MSVLLILSMRLLRKELASRGQTGNFPNVLEIRDLKWFNCAGVDTHSAATKYSRHLGLAVVQNVKR
jgi:hypothetical protein